MDLLTIAMDASLVTIDSLRIAHYHSQSSLNIFRIQQLCTSEAPNEIKKVSTKKRKEKQKSKEKKRKKNEKKNKIRNGMDNDNEMHFCFGLFS